MYKNKKLHKICAVPEKCISLCGAMHCHFGGLQRKRAAHRRRTMTTAVPTNMEVMLPI